MAYKCGQEVFCVPKTLSVVSAIVHSPASFLDLKGEKLRILRIGIKAGCVVFAKYRKLSVSPCRNQTVDRHRTIRGELSRKIIKLKNFVEKNGLQTWSGSLP